MATGSISYSTPINVSPGDVINASIIASNCVTGVSCDWTVSATDINTSQTVTKFVAGLGDNFTAAYGGAVETPPIYPTYYCDAFPPPSVSYSSISFYASDGNQVTPSWIPRVNTVETPQCMFGMDTTSTTLVLHHLNPNLSVSLNGTGLITSSGTHSVGTAYVINYSTATAFTYTWMVQYCYASPCSFGNATDGSHTQFATGVGLTSETMNFEPTDYVRDVIVVVTEYTGGTGRSGWANHVYSGPSF